MDPICSSNEPYEEAVAPSQPGSEFQSQFEGSEWQNSQDHNYSSDSEFLNPNSQAPETSVSAVAQVPPIQRGRPALVPSSGRGSPGIPRTPRQPAVAVSEVRKLSHGDWGKIVDWLEVPENFAMLHGSSTRLGVGQKHPSKKIVFKLMLVTLHSEGFAAFVTTGDNLGKRFTRYQAKWKEALALKNDTGAGLTLQELRCGLTMEAKYEKICPHFARMDALYGEKHNVDPEALASTGIRGCPPIYHEALSDDDDTGAPPSPPAPENIHMAGPEQMDETQHGVHAESAEPEPTEQNTANTGTPGNVEEDTQPPATRATTPTTSAPRRVPTKRALPSSSEGTSKTNVADLYLEKIAGNSEYRKQMIETKDKWATLELADRREARAENARQTREARAELAYQNSEDARMQRRHDEKKAKLAHDHALIVLQTQQNNAIQLGLLQSNRTQTEIESLLTLFAKNNSHPPGS